MKNQKSLNDYIKQSIIDNWDIEALTNLHAETYLFRDIARKIAKIHLMYEAGDIKPGDKIAFCGHNSAEWIIALISALSYGAVAVPILNEFKPDTLHHLINHSDAKVLFVDESIWKHLDEKEVPGLKAAVRLDNYSLLFCRDKEIMNTRLHLNEMFGKRYPERFTSADVKVADVKPDDVVLINYTAGSTGFSKGVMLTSRALWSNIQYTIDDLEFLKPGDNMLSLLPLAHMYGLMVEVLHPLVKGCHIFLLNRTPSPKVLVDAFGVVKPKLIVAVPLILEKIIRTRVFPTLQKQPVKFLLKIPIVRDRILKKVKASLCQVFGGNLIEMIIGGAALAKDVEDFLRKIDFPVTVGYGMTECAPLISYCPHETQRAGSCGKVVDRMEIHIESPDPISVPGVLWVKGDNVMKGYYKNDEATESVIKDGWMNTGDICQIDSDGYIYIRGRDKTMILGPSGQNIYPEEIEALLINNPLVAECIVVEKGGKLVALIYPNFEVAESMSLTDDNEIRKVLRNLITEANKTLPSYSQLADVEIRHEEFEKTPKRSIKRYLYQT